MVEQKSCFATKISDQKCFFASKMFEQKSCFAPKLFEHKACFAPKMFEQKSPFASKMIEQKFCFAPKMFEQKAWYNCIMRDPERSRDKLWVYKRLVVLSHISRLCIQMYLGPLFISYCIHKFGAYNGPRQLCTCITYTLIYLELHPNAFGSVIYIILYT